MEGKKPLLLAVFLIQAIYAGYLLLTKLAFNAGMNTFVFVFYRQASATLFLAPIAFVLERKTAPPLSVSIFIKIFMLSLGITVPLNLVGVGIKYTTASLGAATSNTLPVITFFFAVIMRMEKVNLRTSPGIMKIVGVCICLSGVATLASYRGPHLKLPSPHHFDQFQEPIPSNKSWLFGLFLILLSNVTWSLWMVLQGRVLRDYPSKLLLTTLQCFLSTIQSFLVAIAFARDHNQWKIGWDLRLLSVLYCGIVVTGVTFYLQSWVIEKKGPVFLAMTTPVQMVFTGVLSGFVLGEVISLGSVLGTLLLVGGLYSVLWGKTKEEQRAKGEVQPIGDAEKSSEGSKDDKCISEFEVNEVVKNIGDKLSL